MLIAIVLTALYGQVNPSVVEFQYKKDSSFETWCSAVVVEMDVHPLIVTEDHCLTEGQVYTADTVPLVQVLQRDGFVAFRAQGRASRWRAIKLAPESPKPGEDIFAAGFAYTNIFTVTRGTVAGYSTWENVDRIWMEIEQIGGMSGGPILDRKGRLLTLVRQVRVDAFMSPNGLAASASPSLFQAFVADARRAPEGA